MKFSLHFLFVLTMAVPGLSAKDPDFIVYGGTPGTTGGLSATDVGPKPEILGGFAREFYARANAKYSDPARTAKDFWFHEPHIAEQTFTELLREAGVTVVFGARVESVEKVGARVVAFTTTDGQRYPVRLFADASYEGDLMARAGIRFVVGRESSATYDEALAGFRPAPLRPRTVEFMATPGTAYVHGTPGKISAYQNGKLLPGINTEWPEIGSGDRRSQSYNFRVIVTANPANRVPFPKPANYEPLRYKILARIIDAFPGVRFEELVYLGALPNGKYDANASGLVQGTDHVGGNVNYTDAGYVVRDRIWQDHVDYVQGFFWFLANDPRVTCSVRPTAKAAT